MKIDGRITSLAATILVMTSCAHVSDPLQEWMRAGASAEYRTPSPGESAALAEAFAAALRGVAPTGLTALGYESKDVVEGSAWREAFPRSRGWGAFLFRAGPARSLVLQAPHADSDLRTGDVALALYRASHARLLALNSAHRSLPMADQANATDAPFSLMGREAGTHAGGPLTVVQLHGFGAETASRYGLNASTAVISNGTRNADPVLRAQVACLRVAGFDARAFPEEAPFPGGTRNAVRAAMAEAGAGRFVHAELGWALRRKLAGNTIHAGAFAACL